MSNPQAAARRPVTPMDFSPPDPEPEKPGASGLTDGMMDEIRTKVIRVVDSAGAITREALIFTVMSSLSIRFDVKTVIEYISMIAQECAKTGRISSVSCDPNGRPEVTYYPKDTTFSVVPSRFLAGDSAPPPIIEDRDRLNYNNMKHLLDLYPGWMLNLFAEMCPRCGHIKEAHICNTAR